MEYVCIPQGDGTGKLVPIPVEVINETPDRSAVLSYLDALTPEQLDAAEMVVLDEE